MRVGVHQPNFLPWMGYFFKMAQCDVFVLLDHVEYTKQSFTKRIKIHKPENLEDEQYIIVPLQKHSDFASINSLQLVENNKWQKKIANQIHQSYHKAPYYYQIEPLIERFFNQPLGSNSFSHFTIELIQHIAEMLELNPKWILSSDLKIECTGKDVNFDIVNLLEGQAYISGMGAKKYLDESRYTEKNIALIYSDFPNHFTSLGIPAHFLNKSVLSYLACYEMTDLKRVITSK